MKQRLDSDQQKLLETLKAENPGIILIVGPVASGKSRLVATLASSVEKCRVFSPSRTGVANLARLGCPSSTLAKGFLQLLGHAEQFVVPFTVASPLGYPGSLSVVWSESDLLPDNDAIKDAVTMARRAHKMLNNTFSKADIRGFPNWYARLVNGMEAVGHPEYPALLEVYAQHKSRSGLCDFQDLPVFLRGAIDADSKLANQVRGRWKWILVDNAHELTWASWQALQVLQGPRTKLVLFGNPHSHCMGFTGVRSDLFAHLEAEGAVVHRLHRSYRQSDSLQVARRLANSIAPDARPMLTQRGGKKATFRHVHDGEQAGNAVAEQIRAEDGAPSDYMILLRSLFERRDREVIKVLRRELRANGIAYYTKSEVRTAERMAQDIVDFISGAPDLSSKARLLSSAFGWSPKQAIAEVKDGPSKPLARQLLVRAIEIGTMPTLTHKLAAAAKVIREFSDTSVHRILKRVSRYLASFASEDELIAQWWIHLESRCFAERAVLISTIEGARHDHRPNVILIGADQATFPQAGYFGSPHDEQCCLYVATTRHTDRLTVLHLSGTGIPVSRYLQPSLDAGDLTVASRELSRHPSDNSSSSLGRMADYFLSLH